MSARWVVVVMDGDTLIGIHGPYASREKAEAQVARLQPVIEQCNEDGVAQQLRPDWDGYEERHALVRQIAGGPVPVRQYR